jgi:hypothetical protein
MTKTCGKCGEAKDIAGFYRRTSSKDGHASWCKVCDNASRLRNKKAVGRKRNKRIPDSKKCRRCSEVKPFRDFSAMKDSTDGLYSYCKPCKAAMVKDYTTRNGDEVRARARQRNATPKGRLATRKANLKQSFRMTKAQFDKTWREQGKVCAICKVKRKRNEKAFAVDHDHATDAIRGILCHDCNRALGLADDDRELLRAAAAYLRKHARRQVKSRPGP